MNRQLYEIPAAALGILQHKIDKLNKKAQKFGSGDIRLVQVGRRTEELNREWYIVAVEGEPVKFEGFTFVARLDHNTDPTGASNIVYSMPGEELPAEWRSADASCNHCGFRRNRKDTFIMRNHETNNYIQVGRTCLKDFFGHDPAEVARRAQFIVNVHDMVREAKGGEAYMTDRRHINLTAYLAQVSLSIDEHGWTSTAAARESDSDLLSTRDDALDEMFSWPNGTGVVPGGEDHDNAVKTIEYILTLDPAKSNFNFNMVQLAKLLIIDWKATGIAAAMVFCYNRHVEQQAAAAQPKQDLSGSVYVGEIKERLTINVTVLSTKKKEGEYGSYNITRMLDDSGNLYVSFGTFKADPDTRIQIRGTVKRFNEFNGTKQTILNRVMEVK